MRDVRERPAVDECAGCPSSVWTRFGLSASFSRHGHREPAAPSSSAVTGSPSNVEPTVIRAEPLAEVGEIAGDGDDGP